MPALRNICWLVLLALGLWGPKPLLAAQDQEETSSRQEDADQLRNRKGGSFTLQPAFFLPARPLSSAFENTLGYNLDFDIGFSPDWSVIFGAGYADFKGTGNPDYHLLLAPAWFGLKSKNQFLPAAEVSWEMAAVLFYEKSYLIHSSVGAQENLDGGAMLGAGYDIWWTRWLLTGMQARILFVVEQMQIFPIMQLGLRIGVRG